MNPEAVRSPLHRLARRTTGLLVVDIQERVLAAMFEKERVRQNALRLIQGAALFKLPLLVTEQYPRGLGATVPELAAAMPGAKPVEKVTFDACHTEAFQEALRAVPVSNWVVCGIEAHVCVCLTCLGLLEAGFTPVVAADAVSSRTRENWQLGLDRMRQAGAMILSTEMVLFELLGRAGTEEFKQVLGLVK